MRLLSSWIREFVDIPADDRQLAADLTMAGVAVDSVAVEQGQAVLEADVTTNRPDAMNHYGVAREASAIYDRDLKPYRASPVESARPALGVASVEIADPDLCARYSARVILGVKVGPSPEWMVKRLEAAGTRSINNVADVTNYLLLELGHPLHAFDLDLLAGRRIIVRRGRAGERMATLDGVVRELTAQNLVIADGERPVAIAGVMGGLDSGIRDQTTNVLLESAWFEPRSIRGTARRFGMHTDASHRFERGADLGITAAGADRAAELIREVAGGEVLCGLIDVFPAPRPRPALLLRQTELERILGERVPPERVEQILRRLGFRLAADGAGQWMVEPPSFRLDVEREIDVIEEVARLFGYQRFPTRLPQWSGVARRAPHWHAERALRETARALGYSQTISFTLIAPRQAEPFSLTDPVRLANPLSEEASVMRPSIVPGLLNAVEWNLNRGTRAVRLFEIGKVYAGASGRYEEPSILGLAATGPVQEGPLHAAPRDMDFFDLKGDVEAVLDLFQCGRLYFDANAGADYYHPGRAARAAMDGETVARFGQLHPRMAAERKWRQPVLIAELYLDRLFCHGLRRPKYEPVSRVPAVDRDFSLVVPDAVAWERIESAVGRLGIQELAAVHPVEILRGGPVAAGSYGLLLRTVFQRPGQTLSDTEVNEWSARLIAALQELGIALRA
ncbi:MAG: phenylalanine--tRNA ligase subunit beta [Acidobacteria bacterium]|nr:phenylalanine--tRNA ligase subunit beta [Acidobacteriota bacterium]